MSYDDCINRLLTSALLSPLCIDMIELIYFSLHYGRQTHYNETRQDNTPTQVYYAQTHELTH